MRDEVCEVRVCMSVGPRWIGGRQALGESHRGPGRRGQQAREQNMQGVAEERFFLFCSPRSLADCFLRP